MNINIPKGQLSRVLSMVQNIVEKKTTMPILSNVLLSAADGQLKVSATDLEITAVARTPATVHGAGSTTVNAKVLSEIVRELPEADVTLKLLEGERLEISALSSKLKIVGVNAGEYPSLPGMAVEVRSRVSASQLLEMINRTIYAVSTDETRFNLNGVCFEPIGEKEGELLLRMVATDGHRLSMVTRPTSDLRFSERVIVPRKGLQELRKLLDEEVSAEVGLDVRDGFLVLETGEAKVSMRLIDGEFPDYNQVLPTTKGEVAAIPTAEFTQALRRVSLMVSDKGKCVKLDFSREHLRISSSSPELGEAREELPVTYAGEPLSVGFNARYLLDIAASIGEEPTLKVELNGELGPGKFFGEKDESCIAIVMPMRLN